MTQFRRARVPLHGWLVLDKPRGPTSADLVAKVKRLLSPEKIGHGGTLDPLATGVLPLALGEATKTMPYILDSDKSYAFTLAFGFETTTDDSQGTPTASSSVRPAEAELRAVLPRFTGPTLQMPPAVSALKVGGERAYDLVRQGIVPDLKPRAVTVHSLDLLAYDGQNAMLEAKVSKGTYIRGLARDIARALGAHGHVTALRRLAHGPFTLAGALTAGMLDKLAESGEKPPILPVDVALHGLAAHHVSPAQADRLRHGLSIPLQGQVLQVSGPARVYAEEGGELVSIVEVDSTGTAQPLRVFNLKPA